MTDDHKEYEDKFVRGLEFMWGEGYMSPGGREEVSHIISDTPVHGCRVLDIGCGLGGIDLALVEDHGANEVVGIDVEPELVERGQQLITRKGMSGRIELQLVEPGNLPFPDSCFDGVFSKDSLLHITDKGHIFKEIFRVLRPGGWLAVSDWLGNGKPPSQVMLDWLDVFGLSFELDTLEHAGELVRSCGFTEVETEDRNAWYAGEMRNEIASISGDNFPRLVAAVGEATANQRVASSTAKLKVVDGGELRPGHIRGRKPV